MDDEDKSDRYPTSNLAISPHAGVTVTPVDDVSFQLFAPNSEAMDEAREMIDEFLADEVGALYLRHKDCNVVL